jgi:uncharacterized membrane protein AbrB (regulator of aidB expression)
MPFSILMSSSTGWIPYTLFGVCFLVLIALPRFSGLPPETATLGTSSGGIPIAL